MKTAVLSQQAFTLVEVVMAAALGALTISAGLYGYVLSAKRAEWAGYSLAANSLAMQRLEQVRSAKWDPWSSTGVVDQVIATSFPMETNALDIPMLGTNIVWATNFTTITTVSATPPLKMIRVDCVWNFMKKRNFTNTVVSYRAPDQ